AAQDAAMIVEAVGGHIQERVEQSAQDETSASAYLVMRIPAAAVTDALASIGELGTVEGTSLTSTEVTAQAKDLDARIHALEVSVSRLEDLLGRAGSIDDVVAAEQVLTDRQSQLESLQSQRNALAEQVDLSTIRLDLWSAGEAPSDPNPSFFGGLATGWDALVVTLTGALALIGVLIPWFVFVALVVAVVWFVRRQVLSRRPPKPPRQDAPPTWPGWSGPGPVTSLPLAPGAAPVARPAAAPTAAPVAASPAATVAGPAPQTSGTPAGAPPETQPLPPA
ncbi:MAG: DUF4349 domain-containing protein, partial [Cellulomonadaceae bacterium]|nr:DUF4349 domain-containing protein [Cellulomonadaceae bacterium]